jgi:hypothetical protein
MSWWSGLLVEETGVSGENQRSAASHWQTLFQIARSQRKCSWFKIGHHSVLVLIKLILGNCKKVCQWLAADRWFSPDTPVSSTNKPDHHDITEILLKVALNTIIGSSWFDWYKNVGFTVTLKYLQSYIFFLFFLFGNFVYFRMFYINANSVKFFLYPFFNLLVQIKFLNLFLYCSK